MPPIPTLVLIDTHRKHLTHETPRNYWNPLFIHHRRPDANVPIAAT